MILLAAFLLVLAAAVATVWATIAGLAGMNPDFEYAALLAIACLVGAIALSRVEHAQRRRLTEGRAQVWARRDREAGQR